MLSISHEYTLATHSPVTGKLYMPSQKWGGWMVRADGVKNSFGGPLCNTFKTSLTKAHEEALNYKAKIYLFRRGDPCVLKAMVWWDNVENRVQEITY